MKPVETVSAVVNLSGGSIRITGIGKGSGMIHPNMATMLGYILTDVELTKLISQLFVKDSLLLN